MKYSLSLLTCLIVAATSFSQVNYRSISFADALKKSKEEGKLIFVQFESKDCKQCNEVADKGLNNRDLSQKIEQTFIPLKITVDNPDREAISAKYNMRGFGTMFIDAEGTLIHSFLRTSTMPAEYFDQISIALDKAGESLKLSELEQEYKNGNKGFGVVELILTKRKTLNLPLDDLLDEYVTLLPKDSLTTVHTIQFIEKMYPLIGSNAEKVARASRDSFLKAWYLMPNQERVTINNMVMYKSMKKAIAEKNESYAVRIANFGYGVNAPDVLAGRKAATYQMLNFYEGIRDSVKYFRTAENFYDTYVMTMSIDSIKHLDSLDIKKMLSNSTPIDTIIQGRKTTVRRTMTLAARSQFYSTQLTDAANTFYKKTSDPTRLLEAILWVRRALEFYESPQALDTYSRLLYKTQHIQEAIQSQEKSIAIRKKQGFPTTEYEAILQKMKSGGSID